MQMQNLKSTRGVQVDEVWGAADAVLIQGDRPTIERVRAHLGRGSPNTVAPMLDAWYASLGKRLNTEGATQEGEQGALPAPVLRAVKALWGRAQQQAEEQAAESVCVERELLDQQVKQLAHLRQKLDQEQQKLDERSEALGAALQAKDQQIADLTRQVTTLQNGMASGRVEIESLRAQLAKAASALQAEHRRLNELTEEHRQERGLLEQRASAHEKRLMEELDRARLEVKRLALVLADDNKKANKALADAQAQVQSLRVQVSALGAENTVLAREVLSAREDLRTAQLQQDQFRQDATALLSHLKARLPKDDVIGDTLARRTKAKTMPKRPIFRR